ncbi:MAG: RluA family pseudouridine synthase [Actinomycetota bacterium]
MGKRASETYIVEAADEGSRLDAFLAAKTGVSRARAQKLIAQELVSVNGSPAAKSDIIKKTDKIAVNFPTPEPSGLEPEDIPIKILYEDDDLMVLSKPPGLVVHPAPGHLSGTLVNALLAHTKGLSGVGGINRPGIVHRLDRDTSGLMIVAKTDEAHQGLAAALKKREIRKTYTALVEGSLADDEGEIVAPVGRHLKDRKKMAVSVGRGRDAVTRWRALEQFKGFTLIEVSLITGRTHQIRVHLQHIGHPVAGDPVYGHGAGKSLHLSRQFLHASGLSFKHPVTDREMVFKDELPSDLREALKRV